MERLEEYINELVKSIKGKNNIDDNYKKMLIQQILVISEICKPYKQIEEELGIDLITLFKDGIENVSDGYHTFNDLYFQRLVLFATLVNLMPEKCWKTYKHEDNELCFGGGWFLITIETPKGSYGYHFENKYWNYFNCKEIKKAKHWDGYTDKDVERLLSLTKEELEK